VFDPEIPVLDLALQATSLACPVTKWGTRARHLPMPGTWHFYCNDYVFSHVFRIPALVPRTRCQAAVEPNFSTTDEMPNAELIWLTYKKRLVSKRWQQEGVRVLVDLNVCKKAQEINLLGVPKGWLAYATRAHKGVPLDAIEEQFGLAAEHAGTGNILFVVFGGGRKRIRQHAIDRGWEWVPEHRQVVAGLERPYGQR
jgi:hypothetical protein